MSSAADPVAYLRSLGAVRERCGAVLAAARSGKTKHFSVREDKLDEVARFVHGVMTEAYADGIEGVKFHSRWRHFEPDGVDRVGQVGVPAIRDANLWPRAALTTRATLPLQMRADWQPCDKVEAARRLIDLALVRTAPLRAVRPRSPHPAPPSLR